MKIALLTNVFLLSLGVGLGYADTPSSAFPQKINAIYSNEDVSLRFHAQWTVDERTREKIQKTYGGMRIDFDRKGHPIPHGLTPEQIKRWNRLYMLCMSDGCYYCDADEGSCELGTCGPRNESCSPYTGPDGHPICGKVCADYAFKSILICNDPS